MTKKQLRQLIVEIVEQDNVDSELSSIFADLGSEIGSVIKKEKEESVNEITGLGILSLVLNAPSLLETIGTILNFVYKKILKLFNKNGKSDSLKFANWLIKSGNNLHSKYIKIIEFALKPFMGDRNRLERREVAEISYLLILVALCAVFGMNAAKDLAHVKSVFPAIERSYATVINAVGAKDLNQIEFKKQFLQALKSTYSR
jgi:hypothetical protein